MSLLLKGGNRVIYLVDTEHHTRTHRTLPFHPLQVNGVGSNTRPREVVAKFKKHDSLTAARVIYLTNRQTSEVEFQKKTENHLSILGDEISNK